jgi:hypothetical protein
VYAPQKKAPAFKRGLTMPLSAFTRIQKLNEQDKATVLEMVDAFLRDRKTKRHYAE